MICYSDEIEKRLKHHEQAMLMDGKPVELVEAFFDEGGDTYDAMYTDVLEEIADMIVGNIESSLSVDDTKERRLKSTHRRKYNAIWGEGMAWLRSYHTHAMSASEAFRIYAELKLIQPDKVHLEEALYRINARALLVYEEVTCLLENGYPDGAMAHYRTLYELWAVAEFLYHDEDSEAVAIDFMKTANNQAKSETGHYKWAKTSKRFQDRENDVSISALVKEAHKTYLKRPGKDASLSKLAKNHEFPNLLIHPSAFGLEIFSSIFPNAKTVGMANPAISASIKLNEINEYYFYVFADYALEDDDFPYIKSNAYICYKSLDAILSNKIIPMFNKIEHGD